MKLANYIMKLATARPPEGREDWAQAMQAEYEVIDIGRLRWALGCLMTATGWRLYAERSYLLITLISIVLIREAINPIMFWTMEQLEPGSLKNLATDFHLGLPLRLMLFGHISFFLALVGLGAWRPDRVALTAAAVALIDLVFKYISIFLSPYAPDLHKDTALRVLGLIIVVITIFTMSFAVYWMCGRLGGLVRKLFVRTQTKA